MKRQQAKPTQEKPIGKEDEAEGGVEDVEVVGAVVAAI
jgi:hypothetical protein